MNPIRYDLHPKQQENENKLPMSYEGNKEKGDENYESGNFKDAIKYFTEGIKYCETDNQKCYMNAYLGYSYLNLVYIYLYY